MGKSINVNTVSLTDTFVKNIDDMSVQDLATKQDVISDDSKDKLVSVIDTLKTMATEVVQTVDNFDTFLVNMGKAFDKMDGELAKKIGGAPDLDTVKIYGGSNSSDDYFTPTSPEMKKETEELSKPLTDGEARAAGKA